MTVFFTVGFGATVMASFVRLIEPLQAAPHATNGAELAGRLFTPACFAVLSVALAAAVRYLARRFSRTSLELMIRKDSRAPILFLRSFSDDQVRLERPKRNVLAFLVLLGEPLPTLDHILLEEGTAQGPVTIGAPGTTPPFGAARAYVRNDNWTQVVSDLAQRSHAIVMTLDQTTGIKWELNEVHAKKYTSKVLHLLPPRLTPAQAARSVVTEVCAALPELANVFRSLQQFLDVNERCCVGWYFGQDAQLNVLTTARPNEASYRIAVRDYLHSNEVELVEQRIANQGGWGDQKLGFAAFVLAVVALSYRYLLSEFILAETVFLEMNARLVLLVLFLGEVLIWLTSAASIVLGIAGALARSSRFFSLVGIVVGIIALLLLSPGAVKTMAHLFSR